MNASLPLAALLALASPAVLAQDWPQFRGPQANSVAAAPLPARLDAQSVQWAIDLPGRGFSSPIVVGDRLFVTSSSGPRQDRLHVLCFNLADGTRRWERQFWATGRTMTHEKISAATPGPASDGRHVFAIFSSNDCVALDLDGQLLWFRGLGLDYPNASNSLGMSSSLLVVDGVVVAMVENDSQSFTAGLDALTGVNRWKLDRPRKANWTSPSLVPAGPRTLVALQSAEGVAVVDPASGTTVWRYQEGASTVASTTVAGGRLYVPSNGLTVLEPPAAGGAPRQVWRSAQLRPGTPSPVVVGDRVYLLNDGGILTCGQASDGKRLWQLRLKGPFSATPVAAGGFLYCVNEAGKLQVVDPSAPEGAVASELDLGPGVLGSPSVSAGSLFVRGEKKLWRIGRPASAL